MVEGLNKNISFNTRENMIMPGRALVKRTLRSRMFEEKNLGKKTATAKTIQGAESVKIKK